MSVTFVKWLASRLSIGLTIDAVNLRVQIPEYKICAVKIEPATAAELDGASSS